jgi:hypothetical protein
MGAFDGFLKRRGFVKLDRYGLVVTDDDCIVSSHTGTIVGWADDHPSGPVKAAPRSGPSIASAAELMMVPQAVSLAPAQPIEEDEWEWEIAMARARAAADDI